MPMLALAPDDCLLLAQVARLASGPAHPATAKADDRLAALAKYLEAVAATTPSLEDRWDPAWPKPVETDTFPKETLNQ